jgi:hypothetical protein
MNETKKCPLCAETIPLAPRKCEFCGARFNVSSSGYCQTCHLVCADCHAAAGRNQL